MGSEPKQKTAELPSLFGAGDVEEFDFQPIAVPSAESALENIERVLGGSEEQEGKKKARRRGKRIVPCESCGNPFCPGSRVIEE